MRRYFVGAVIALGFLGWTLSRQAPLQAQGDGLPKDTIIMTASNNTDRNEIWKIIPGKEPVLFANVATGVATGSAPWICPIGIGPNGHLYVASWGNQGTLWDLTKGGNRTSDTPMATKIFATQPGKMCGMAFDAAGNVYLDNSERGVQPIMKVTPAGKFSALQVMYNTPRGLAVAKNADNKEILYIAEGSQGVVRAYNLTDDKAIDPAFATGFQKINDHTPAAIVADHRGRILALWRTSSSDNNTGAVFDITKGGDFADLAKTPPLTQTQFRMDVNQMAVDSQNNLYIAGNDSATCWASLFLGGQYTPFLPISGSQANLGDLADTEAIAIAP